MRNIFLQLSLVLLLITSCTGPSGPVGPRGATGATGENGYNFVGETLEYVVDFTPENKYEVEIKFDNPLYDSDVVLVYILEGQDDFGNDIWRQVPRPVYFGDDVMSYEYDFTVDYIRLFIDADASLDLSTIESLWTLDQTFRIVVVPSDFPSSMKSTSYKEVTKTLNITSNRFVKKE